MRKSVLAVGGILALATVGFAASANASLVSLTFVEYGGGITPPLVPTGETSVALDSSTLSGSYSLVTGSKTDVYAAPAYSPSTADPNQYLAEDDATATLSLGGSFTGVEIYVGSLDSFNTISFSNGLIFTGAELVAMSTGGAADSGNQTAGSSNGLFYFVFSKDEAVTSVTFASSSNALEVAGVSVSNAIPESSTWAMLVLGFAGLGYAAFRRSAKDQSAVNPI
jgi:hypothetical protein